MEKPHCFLLQLNHIGFFGFDSSVQQKDTGTGEYQHRAEAGDGGKKSGEMRRVFCHKHHQWADAGAPCKQRRDGDAHQCDVHGSAFNAGAAEWSAAQTLKEPSCKKTGNKA